MTKTEEREQMAILANAWERSANARTETVVRETPPRPVPKPVHRLIPDDKLAAYELLAEQVGYAPAELYDSKLRAVIEEMGWQEYDFQEVNKWLMAKAPEGERWYWCPLRNQDVTASSRPLSYRHVIPAHALAKVGHLEARMPGECVFMVSDYEAVEPDPFLAVWHSKGSKLFIIDMWDEPGFGEPESEL